MRVHLTSINGVSYRGAVVLAANDAWVVDVPPMHLSFGTGRLEVAKGKLYAQSKHGDTYIDGVLQETGGREWKAWDTLATTAGWKVTWYPKCMFNPRVVYSVGDSPMQSVPVYLAPKSVMIEFAAVPPGRPMADGFINDDDLELDDPFEDAYNATSDYTDRYMWEENDHERE